MFTYVAAMCCRKMLRRWEHVVSVRYFTFLEAVSPLDVPRPSRRVNQNYSTGDEKEDHKDGLSDYFLLTQFAALAKMMGIDIPVLSGLELPDTPDHLENFNIYNDLTCHEFHYLIINVIKGLKDALFNLSKTTPTTPVHHTQWMLEAQIYGYVLLRISRGRAFRLHLQNIALALVISFPTSGGAPAPMPALSKDDNEETDDNEEGDGVEADDDDVDEELRAMQAHPYPDYVNWLRLMVSPFDAVEIVLRFVRSSKRGFKSFSIQTLLSPQSSNDLLPWRELFSSPYFPQPQPASPPAVSNTDLLEFLEEEMTKALEARKLSGLVATAEKEWRGRDKQPQTFKFTRTKDALKLLAKMLLAKTSSASMTEAELAVEKIEKWVAGRAPPPTNSKHAEANAAKANGKEPITDAEINVLDNEITQHIKKLSKTLALGASNFFFCSLDRLEFRGAIHCEASLASLINNAARRELYSQNEVAPSIHSEMQVLIPFPICFFVESSPCVI